MDTLFWEIFVAYDFERFKLSCLDSLQGKQFCECVLYFRDIPYEWLEWMLGNVEIDVNIQQNYDGSSPLYTFVKCSFYNHAKLLLRHGANPCLSDRQGFTPLHVAAFKRNYGDDILSLILDHYQGDVNVCNSFKRTPLCEAISHTAKRNTLLLIDRGASIRAVENYYQSPVYKWVYQIEETRNQLRKKCLAILVLRRSRSVLLQRNGRDVLRIVSQHIWSQRNLQLHLLTLP